MAKARAAVQVADRKIELREFDVPSDPQPGGALLKVEASGICGSDVEQYSGAMNATGLLQYPVIPGHEPIGRIAKISPEAQRIWGVKEGDRVAVEPFAPCGVCDECTQGNYQFCRNRFLYAYTSTTVGSGLWGGYSEWMELRPNTVVHKLPENLSTQDAVLFNPLGAGFEWAYRAAGTQPGDTVLVLGPGQRGLSAIIGAKEAGASTIIVTGLTKDAPKLELAKEFGATDTINVETENTVERVREITGGRMADRAVDVSAFATQPVLDAIDAVKPGGTVVLAGIKGMKAVPGFISDKLPLNGITVRGALGVRSWAYEQAIRVVKEHKYPFEKMHTHTFHIDEADRAIRTLAGEIPGETAIHVTMVP
jgi:threonine dehydrogenase-like Zn-dependent dehydrogenase